MRLDTISFFLLVLVVVALVIQKLWNYLAKDFAKLPRLGFMRAFALTMILGLGMTLILSMISGARELFTPGAWQRNGLVYNIAPTPTEHQQLLHLRREKITSLKTALWVYAEHHDQKLPPNHFAAGISREAWRTTHPSEAVFQYRLGSGLLKGPTRLIAYEPEVYEKKRFILYSDGSITLKSRKEMEEVLQN